MDAITPQMLDAIKRRNKSRHFLAMLTQLLWLLALTGAVAVIGWQMHRERSMPVQAVQVVECDKAADGVSVCADFRQRLAANGTTFPRGK